MVANCSQSILKTNNFMSLQCNIILLYQKYQYIELQNRLFFGIVTLMIFLCARCYHLTKLSWKKNNFYYLYYL